MSRRLERTACSLSLLQEKGLDCRSLNLETFVPKRPASSPSEGDGEICHRSIDNLCMILVFHHLLRTFPYTGTQIRLYLYICVSSGPG